MLKKIFHFIFITLNIIFAQSYNLTLPAAIDMAYKQSHVMQRLEMQYKTTLLNKEAQDLYYATSLDLSLETPSFYNNYSQAIDPSTGTLYIVRQNNLSNKASLSFRRPFLLTGGDLSVTTSLYHLYQAKTTTFQPDISIGINQPLFGTNTGKIQQLENEYTFKRQMLENSQAMAELRYTVTDSYCNALKEQMRCSLQQENYATSTEIHNLESQKYLKGLTVKNDLLGYEVEMNNARIQLMQSQSSCQKAITALKTLLGMNENGSLLLSEENMVDTTGLPGLDSLLELSQDSSLTNAYQKIDLSVKQLGIKRQNAERQFKVNVSGQVGVGTVSHNFNNLGEELSSNQQASILITVPLIDAGRSKRQMAAAKNELKMLELDQALAQKQLQQNVRDLYASYILAQESYALATTTEQNAHENYDYCVTQYRLGLKTGNELLQDKDRLNQAIQNRLEASTNYLLSKEKIKSELRLR